MSAANLLLLSTVVQCFITASFGRKYTVANSKLDRFLGTVGVPTLSKTSAIAACSPGSLFLMLLSKYSAQVNSFGSWKATCRAHACMLMNAFWCIITNLLRLKLIWPFYLRVWIRASFFFNSRSHLSVSEYWKKIKKDYLSIFLPLKRYNGCDVDSPPGCLFQFIIHGSIVGLTEAACVRCTSYHILLDWEMIFRIRLLCFQRRTYWINKKILSKNI